jgi:zinc protease
LKLRPLAYKTHAYKWATIGQDLKQIEDARMEDVKAFFKKHYNPLNAIMVVGGNVTTAEIKALAEKWFEPIPSGMKYFRDLPKEEVQLESRTEVVYADVPLDAIYMAFKMPARMDDTYQAYDLMADILSQGQSSRLYNSLLKEQQLFSDVHAYITSSIDEGLFIIEGKLVKGVSTEVAEKAIWEELRKLTFEEVTEKELTKVMNKSESIMVFAEMSLLDKAMNLAYYELLGDADLLNTEIEKYHAVTPQGILNSAKATFKKEQCSTLYYLTATDA